jgi:flagellar protein FlgJ
MDITGLGSAYFNDMALDGGVGRGKPVVNNLPDFEELLKRAAASQTEAPAAPEATVVHAANTSNGKAATAVIDKTSKLYEACLGVETILVKNMISSMRNTVQKSGLIEEGYAGKMYEDMLYDEYAREYTKNAHFGMAEMLYLEYTGQRGKVIIR